MCKMQKYCSYNHKQQLIKLHHMVMSNKHHNYNVIFGCTCVSYIHLNLDSVYDNNTQLL